MTDFLSIFFGVSFIPFSIMIIFWLFPSSDEKENEGKL